MITGLTYDLRETYLAQGFSQEEVAEFDSEETISGIERTLNDLGYKTERVGNLMELCTALVKGKRWDLVFNIAEGLYGTGREAQVPSLLDAFKIPYVFSDPAVLAITLHKAMAKHVVKGYGVPTAPFVIVRDKSDFAFVNLEFPLFIKPLTEGTGKGISLNSIVNSAEELSHNGRELLEKFKQPVLVEEYLPGREFTVGITGTGMEASVCGVMEISVKGESHHQIYSHFHKENYEELVKYSIPEEQIIEACRELSLKVWNALECRDGGRIDLKTDRNGHICFIEVNPLAGLNPIHSDLPILCRLNGISYTELLKRIMDSALKRITKNSKTLL